MQQILKILFLFCLTKLVLSSDPELEEEELRAVEFMDYMNEEMEKEANLLANAEWDYSIDLTEENLKKKNLLVAETSAKEKDRWEQLNKFNWKSFTDPMLKREFMLNSVLGEAALPKDDVSGLEKIISEMTKAYSTATICAFDDNTKCDVELNPDIELIHANSRNEEELKHVWLSWTDAVGPHIRHLYRDYVHLMNKTAHLNNFNSTIQLWLFPYEELDIKNFRDDLFNLWEQIKPLYQQLHAYVRHRLRKLYGHNVVSERGPIPAHLLGNVWGQNWMHIADDFRPYPDTPPLEVTESLLKQNYTVDRIFRTAEEFYLSLGFSSLSDTFWKKSIFTKPPDKDMVCHASAWDFSKQGDVRIKMCTSITEEDFYVAHHEMGHIEYYMRYSHQPATFRFGANPGFHEAIGDTIALSVASLKHLKKLDLSDAALNDSRVVINMLFAVAAVKLPMVPWSLMVDNWRWGVFSGEIPFEEYNCKWWKYREEFQGIKPPVPRTEDDFDPGSKFHIPSGTPYIRYFVAIILQFQFHRALCEESGEYDVNNPLHLCDIHESGDAGELLRKMLSLGNSKPWPDALEAITGQRKMDARPLLDYFRPLQLWLEKQNRIDDVHIGWDKENKACTGA